MPKMIRYSILTLALALAAIGFSTAFWPGPAPEVEIVPSRPGVGRTGTTVLVRVKEKARGVTYVRVEALQNGAAFPLEERSFPSSGPGFWRKGEIRGGGFRTGRSGNGSRPLGGTAHSTGRGARNRRLASRSESDDRGAAAAGTAHSPSTDGYVTPELRGSGWNRDCRLSRRGERPRRGRPRRRRVRGLVLSWRAARRGRRDGPVRAVRRSLRLDECFGDPTRRRGTPGQQDHGRVRRALLPASHEDGHHPPHGGFHE